MSYFVGDRSGQSALALMDDLRSRITNKVQITTDGHSAYLDAVEAAFGDDVRYAQLANSMAPRLPHRAATAPLSASALARCV